MATSFWRIKWLWLVVFVLCLTPQLYLTWLGATDRLGINSIARLEHFTGDWTLRFLMITLAITPLRRFKALSPLVKFRRQLGLWTFFYGSIHMLIYFAVDVQWNWQVIREDLTIRRFFVVGFMALMLMVPLALTSNNRAIRWMGGERWQMLHRLVYLSAILGVIHYALQGKTLTQTPIMYGIVLAILLLYRVVARFV